MVRHPSYSFPFTSQRHITSASKWKDWLNALLFISFIQISYYYVLIKVPQIKYLLLFYFFFCQRTKWIWVVRDTSRKSVRASNTTTHSTSTRCSVLSAPCSSIYFPPPSEDAFVRAGEAVVKASGGVMGGVLVVEGGRSSTNFHLVSSRSNSFRNDTKMLTRYCVYIWGI